MRALLITALFVLVPIAGPGIATAQTTEGRELAALREEQALPRRQLVRLEETMRVLSARLESEGRTRTVDLLGVALERLERRELDAKTLEEWMGT
ncbi:MAG: hypothetical protein ACYSWX_07800, partial [Planctomycetota bacterium]